MSTTLSKNPSPPPALPLDAYSDGGGRNVASLIWGVVGLTVALTGLAAVAPIRKVSLAEGQISPIGALVSVGHPEGGVVAQLHARSGDLVRAGDVLMLLKPVAAESDLAQAAARRTRNILASERLRSLIEDRPADYRAALGGEAGGAEARIAEEAALERSERAKADAATGGLGAVIAQRQSEIATLQAELQALGAQASINAEQLAMRRGLARDGYATRDSVLDAELSVGQTQARMEQVRGQLASARSALAQARNERMAALADQQRLWTGELTRVATELAELDAGRVKLSDRLAAAEVRAPVSGIIQEIKAKAAGELMPPGEAVATIVPEGSPLIAEVRLPPEELGDVRVGREVRLAITAFDPELYGVIIGRVEAISPTTFESQDGKRYYRAEIGLSRTTLLRGKKPHAVTPGMGVRAEIITGERTLLLHLLKPIQRSLERAFNQ